MKISVKDTSKKGLFDFFSGSLRNTFAVLTPPPPLLTQKLPLPWESSSQCDSELAVYNLETEDNPYTQGRRLKHGENSTS